MKREISGSLLLDIFGGIDSYNTSEAAGEMGRTVITHFIHNPGDIGVPFTKHTCGQFDSCVLNDFPGRLAG